MRTISAAALALSTALLASCGGGGSSEGCHSVGIMPITTTWAVSGGTYSAPTPPEQAVVGKVGVALSARPIHENMLPQCVGKGVYSLGSDAARLPAGLTLDTATGEISGTPTAAGETNGGAVLLTFPGLTSLSVLSRMVVER